MRTYRTWLVIGLLVVAAASARAEPAAAGFGAGPQGPNPGSLKMADVEGGTLITVNLAALGKPAKVHRARLAASRAAPKEADELAQDILVYAGKSKAGKPLALAGPRFDCFDVTEALQAALGGGELNLLVAFFPGWQADRTRLEVVYEGKAANLPPPVKDLQAFHRAGQTFVTFAEPAPLSADKELTYGQYRQLVASAKDDWCYRVYAADKPIEPASILQARLVGQAGPLSCWNVNGRNMEYLIGQAMIQPEKIGELAENTNHLMYTWGPDSPRMDRYPLARLVVDEQAGPLPPGSGLFVNNPDAAGKRYYAVTSCRNGVENLVAPAVAAKPVDESVGPGLPVRQGEGLWGPFFDFPGRRQVYVQWAAPPLAPQPSMYFNWSVLAPRHLPAGKLVPAELYFHSGNFSYAKPRQKFLLESVQIAPHDFPDSGWYGFNSSYGTLRSYKQGAVSNHTQRRIMAFLEWAANQFPIDRQRMLLPGGDGAAMLAMAYPDKFAYVLVNGFEGDVLEPKAALRFAAIWGPKSPDIKDGQGRGDWSWAMLDELAKNARQDLPLFVCRGYSWGPHVKGFAKGYGRFYDAMLAARQPLIADWTWASGNLIKPSKYDGLWRGLDLTNQTPVPAFSKCSTDKNTEGDGQHNLPLSWGKISDAADAVSIVIPAGRGASFDLTPRRLQNFKLKPLQKVQWEATSEAVKGETQPAPQSGQIEVDQQGRLTIPGLKTGRGALTVKITKL